MMCHDYDAIVALADATHLLVHFRAENNKMHLLLVKLGRINPNRGPNPSLFVSTIEIGLGGHKNYEVFRRGVEF
jgi:hypothetical protein